MTEIIIVRHAEAEGNAKRIFHGQYNSVLTEKGHRQAEATGRYLADTKFDVIYSSDLARTYMTAHHIAAFQGCDIIKTKELREINAGKWDNLYYTEICDKYAAEFERWKNDTYNFEFPDGETVKELTERIGRELDRIAAENDGKRICVVTHSTPIHCIKFYYEKMSDEEKRAHTWVPNASVSRGIYENGKFTFDVYGENGFLCDIN